MAFDTKALIRMTTGRIEMLEQALESGDYRGTSYVSRSALEQGLAGSRASLVSLKERADVPTYCHYCGLQTRNSECVECGTGPF